MGLNERSPPPINQGYPPALPTLLYKLRPWLYYLNSLLVVSYTTLRKTIPFLLELERSKNSPSNIHYFAQPNSLRNPIPFWLELERNKNSPEEFSIKHSSTEESNNKKHLKTQKTQLSNCRNVRLFSLRLLRWALTIIQSDNGCFHRLCQLITALFFTIAKVTVLELSG